LKNHEYFSKIMNQISKSMKKCISWTIFKKCVQIFCIMNKFAKSWTIFWKKYLNTSVFSNLNKINLRFFLNLINLFWTGYTIFPTTWTIFNTKKRRKEHEIIEI
jgi:hypothetical protein